MEHAYFKLLHLLAGHASWALTVVFLAAFFESIAFIGTFIPGSSAMFIAGALVGTGSLNLGWVLVCAFVGAVAGDAASYWFGGRYKDRIVQVWPFRTHTGVLDAGTRYFEKHGAKSVVFARFIGPLRAIVPVVAGMLGMRPGRFLAINILSALLWAPVHILPGVVFGASIELAGAVSFRLVVIAAILVALTWVTFKLASVLAAHARAWTSSSRWKLLSWAARHRHSTMGRIVLRALNPNSPAGGLIVVISVFMLISAGVFFSTLDDVARGGPLVQVDMSAYRFVASFRSTWADAVLSVVALLGSVPTLTALVIMVVVWMVAERRRRSVAYWLVAVVFSQLLMLAIQATTQSPTLAALTSGAHPFPSNHLAGTVVIYGFLAFLLARRVGPVQRALVATTTIFIIVGIACSGLYFGRFTISDAVGGTALALIWVFLIALSVVWRHPGKPTMHSWLPIVVLAVVSASVGLQLVSGWGRGVDDHQQAQVNIEVTPMQWTDSLWRTFSCYRSNMEGDRREPITVQWTATAEQITTQLESRGWVEGSSLSLRSLLSLVAPNVPATALPVLPRLNNGEPSAFVFIRSLGTPDERDVLRFWPTPYTVKRRDGDAPTPIWLGSMVHERLRRPAWPFNVLRPERDADPMITTRGEKSPWHDLEVSSSVGCGKVPVTLIESGNR
jgi:membrane protein DedA with SNARE-associated domain/membrane-associated phospholipid phosphatase